MARLWQDRSEATLLRPVLPELDTIRGLAVLWVLFLHGFEWQYGSLHFGPAATAFLKSTQPGSLGVDLFFVLSGFLITGILLDSRTATHYYRRFYTRRAFRILPVYYTLLILLLTLHSSSPRFVLLGLIYLANMTSFFGVACDYGPLWSLAVEEHFYLLWPLVVRNLTREMVAKVCVLVMVFVPMLRLVCFRAGWGRGSLDWYTWFVADGLATGSFVAVALRLWQTRGGRSKDVRIFFGGSHGFGRCSPAIWNRHARAGARRRTTTNHD